MGFSARGAFSAALALSLAAAGGAQAAPTLVVDMDSGQVLHQGGQEPFSLWVGLG